MTDEDWRELGKAPDLLWTVGTTMQVLLGRDMTLEVYLTGEPSAESLTAWQDATRLVAAADQLLAERGISTAKLYS